MDYDKLTTVWIEKDRDSVHMEDKPLKDRIDVFIKAHNTGAMAVGSGDFLHRFQNGTGFPQAVHVTVAGPQNSLFLICLHHI